MADIFVRDANLVSLMQKTGYNITQENGQRIFGPPPGWIGSRPKNGSEIFIKKLPRDVYEDELVPLCEQFGKIYELRLMVDFNGESRGYSFVTYTNVDDAIKAIKHLDDYEIRPGRHIGVCKSIDNCRLFVGGIPKDKSKEEIMAEISKYTEGVSKVILYSSIVDKSKNRGFAFVEYENHRDAAIARSTLLNIRLFDKNLSVDFAYREADVEDETMKRVYFKFPLPPPPRPPKAVLEYLYQNTLASSVNYRSAPRAFLEQSAKTRQLRTMKNLDHGPQDIAEQESPAFEEEHIFQSMPIIRQEEARAVTSISPSSSSSSLLSTKWTYKGFRWIKKTKGAVQKKECLVKHRKLIDYDQRSYFPRMTSSESSLELSTVATFECDNHKTKSGNESSPLKKIKAEMCCINCKKQKNNHHDLVFINLECFHFMCKDCANWKFSVHNKERPLRCDKCFQEIRKIKNRVIK